MTLSAGDFGEAWLTFLRQAVSGVPPVDPPLLARVRDHLATEPAALPVVAEHLPVWEHPNLQRGLDAWLAQPGRGAELLGLAGEQKRHLVLSDLLAAVPAEYAGGVPRFGSVDYVNLDAGRHGAVTCVQFGIYLVTSGPHRLAVMVRGADERMGQSEITVEVVAPTPELARGFLAELRAAMVEHNVYRGQVVTLASPEGPFRHSGIALVGFPDLARPTRDDIVLPQGVLDRIERQTIGFAEHAAELAALGRHLKRGLLLHGPPGTGKTLTVMYLIDRMPGRTVVVLTGRSLGFVGPAFALARSLQPCTVVLEDVDLVAEQRTHYDGANSVLFELLNAMDGLGEDTDTLVLLTTNRPDLLEPALAARPGRVDLAVEIPLPDAEGRRRLLARYGREVGLDGDADDVVARTEGVSAAFVRELVRKATLLALTEGREVTRDHLGRALDELLGAGGVLTARLLGGALAADPR